MHSFSSNQRFIPKQYSQQDLSHSYALSDQYDHSSDRGHLIHNPSLQPRNSRYNEEYSFNRIEETQRDSGNRPQMERQVYRPGSLDDSTTSLKSNPQLLKKYSSIYSQLRSIDPSETIQLFLEEIEENQRNKEKIMLLQRTLRGIEEEQMQLKAILQKKREAISMLCQTESNNLNLIQCLEKQISNKNFPIDSHYQQKYRELENYMNEYISSTNEAQEEFKRNFKLLRSELAHTQAIAERQHHQLFEKNKLLEISSCRAGKAEKSVFIMREKESTLHIKIENLEEENSTLKKELESLIENLKATEQFQIELAKENRELSSELDFIREKVNQNQNISKDIFEKIEENNENTHRLSKDIQKLTKENERLTAECGKLQCQKEQIQLQLSETGKQREQSLHEKEELMSDYQQLCKQLESSRNNNDNLMRMMDEKASLIQNLQLQIDTLNQYQEEIIAEYENEKESKNTIKAQLMELAEQVKFMESTYKQEVVQNEKIKQELQHFWQRKDPNSRVFKDIANESLQDSWKGDRGSWAHSISNTKNCGSRGQPRWREHSQNKETEGETFS